MAEERRYWDPGVETMPLDKLRRLQEERLRGAVAYAYERTGLYRRKFDEAGVRPGDIKTVDDLRKLPLTTYLEDFVNTPLPEKLAIPVEKVQEVHSTSGTVSGFTQPIPMSRKDIELGIYNGEARARWTIGVRPDDMIQVLHGFDC